MNANIDEMIDQSEISAFIDPICGRASLKVLYLCPILKHD